MILLVPMRCYRKKGRAQLDLKSSGSFTPFNSTPMNIRCPACRHIGSFGGIGINDMSSPILVKEGTGYRNLGTKKFGTRICPNPECKSVLFFAEIAGTRERVTFPPEVLDFDATNLPAAILASLEEAIKCHAAGCYRASALMVRRTLEELCEDKKASGANLKARLAALNSVAIIPPELLTAADELRVLGNDAAHIEAKDYDRIGKVEAELAIELTKELLKAVYQYTKLLSRLTDLKKGTTP